MHFNLSFRFSNQMNFANNLFYLIISIFLLHVLVRFIPIFIVLQSKICRFPNIFDGIFISGTANLNAYAQQLPSIPCVATTQAGKFNSGDLDSALSSLADNLSVSSKGATSHA